MEETVTPVDSGRAVDTATLRRGDVDARIARSALDLLRSRGPAGVSVESVAAASGVAKTTIYRRFANRDALLTAAVTSAATAVPIPSGLTAQDTVRWVLRHARDTIEDVVGRGTIAAVMADADPHFTELLLGMIRTTTRPFREDLRQRALAGEIRADLDIELVISMLLGVVVAEMIRGRATDDAWVESVLGLLWPALMAPTGHP
ncbi:MAG TPA: TetR/AcrR family transcriptional regulator [Rhodoglobus sp.]|nr:TetR/AcrR family transcriptional regulator [Rhodoglobus sp.]